MAQTGGNAVAAVDEARVASLHAAISQDLAAGRVTLPVLPAVAVEVLSSTLDTSSDAAHLADLVQQDQSLASHVLRVVNSAAFRGSVEVVALQQAIARLGMVRIRDIALTASVQNALPAKGAFQSLMDDAWRDGLCTALWSQEIARLTRRNVEQSYLCGLLHNVGASLLAIDLDERAPDLPLETAAEVMTQLQCVAGERLVEAWQLPEFVSVCMRSVDDFESAGDASDEVAVVAAGRGFATLMAEDNLEIATVLSLVAVQSLNLYPEDLEALLDRRPEVTTTLSAMIL